MFVTLIYSKSLTFLSLKIIVDTARLMSGIKQKIITS